MPAGDGTGPTGRGPFTGRSAGFCAGFDRPGYASTAFVGRGRFFGNRGLGLGFRRGGGFGRGSGLGWRRLDFAPNAGLATSVQRPSVAQQSREQEISFLRQAQGELNAQLKEVESRLKSMESEEK